jgi:hypothetical protein
VTGNHKFRHIVLRLCLVRDVESLAQRILRMQNFRIELARKKEKTSQIAMVGRLTNLSTRMELCIMLLSDIVEHLLETHLLFQMRCSSRTKSPSRSSVAMVTPLSQTPARFAPKEPRASRVAR